jgi:hypothetical protein
MSQNPHPARSPEFLSRLHDQELTPAERAHFESHRAHCAECRTAAAEFEAALALFRSSGPRPASPDLAARILRKLQQNDSRRRLRFGPTFGIDLRWAGAFAAAVVAAVIASSVVVRNESRPAAILLKSPADFENARDGKVESKAGADQPAGLKKGIGPAAPASAPERAKGDRPAVGSPAGDMATRADKDATLTDAGGSIAHTDAFGKQKESKLESLRAAQEEAPASAPAARERDLRDKTATGFAENGQVSKSQPQAPPPPAVIPSQSNAALQNVPPAENAAASNNRLEAQQSQAASQEPSRKNLTRQQAPKSSVANSDAAENTAPSPGRSPDANTATSGLVPQQAPAAPRGARDAERSGGEGGYVWQNYDQSKVAGLRLVVSPLDSAGAAPELIPATAAELPASLRGQEFVVIVDLAGRVHQVTTRRTDPADGRQANANTGTGASPSASTSANEKRGAKTPAASPLAAVRFQPGATQRRLLIRFE